MTLAVKIASAKRETFYTFSPEIKAKDIQTLTVELVLKNNVSNKLTENLY